MLDTNILASGAISSTGTVSTIVDAWRSGQFKVIVSSPILEELACTFEKPYFRRYLTQTQSSRFLNLLQKRATVSPITVAVHGIATHPEDDFILATAISAVPEDSRVQSIAFWD